MSVTVSDESCGTARVRASETGCGSTSELLKANWMERDDWSERSTSDVAAGSIDFQPSNVCSVAV